MTTATTGPVMIGGEDPDVREALLRSARRYLCVVEERRHVARLHAQGMSQRQIAAKLKTTQPRVHRILGDIGEIEEQGVLEPRPEEMIKRAFVEGTDREELVAALIAYPHTDSREIPNTFDGVVPGTWNEVAGAHAAGLLTDEEFARICAARDRVK